MKKKQFLLIALALLTLFLVTSCEEEKPEPLPPINTYGLDERWFCHNINETLTGYYEGESAYGLLYRRDPVYGEYDLPFLSGFSDSFLYLNKGYIEYEFEYWDNFGDLNVIQRDRMGDPITITGYRLYMDDRPGLIFDDRTGLILPALKIVKVGVWKMTSTGYPYYVDITDTPAAAPYLGWLIYKHTSAIPANKATKLSSFVTDTTDLYILPPGFAWDTNYEREVFRKDKLQKTRNFIDSGEKVSVVAAMGTFTLVEGEEDHWRYLTPLPMD